MQRFRADSYVKLELTNHSEGGRVLLDVQLDSDGEIALRQQQLAFLNLWSLACEPQFLRYAEQCVAHRVCASGYYRDES